MISSISARRLTLVLSTACIVVVASAGSAFAQQQRISRRVPGPAYFAYIAQLYDGDTVRALKGFQDESRSAIKSPQGRWIDSICFYAMQGECYYIMGQYPQALEHYNAALELFAAHANWMLRIQRWPPTIATDAGLARRTAPWGKSGRGLQPGNFPEVLSIAQGRINNMQAVQQGGVVQPPMLFPINAIEIIRCTALSLRRKRELMGPACKYDPVTASVLAQLRRKPGPPNHWSEAWIDLQLGLAHACAEETAQAQQYLQRSLIVAGQFDHPLAGIALIELGKLSLEAGDFQAATNWFAEAGYNAVTYENPVVLGEAIRLGQRTHLMSNAAGVYPPLATVGEYARVQDNRQLEAYAAILAAENFVSLDDPQKAETMLGRARPKLATRQMRDGNPGAYYNYVAALVNFQRGRQKDGEGYLADALSFMGNGSKWLFQIQLIDNLVVKGSISDREAVDVYARVLRDPRAEDWNFDPLEALSVLKYPHPLAYEHWFEAAMRRKEFELAMEISDLARRHRFFSSLPMGGRSLSLRWVLEGSSQVQAAAIQRQSLLADYPQYDKLSQQAQPIEQELKTLSLMPANEDEKKKLEEMFGELAQINAARELVLSQVALRREPAEMVFPPMFATADVQKSLQPGQGILMFFSTSRGMHGFFLNNDKYANWQLDLTGLQKPLVGLLRDLGNYDPNREVDVEVLDSPEWKQRANELLTAMMAGSNVNLGEGVTELIIVPDGPLWYVPFEALTLDDDPDAQPLINRMRIRYAPTFGLARPDSQPRSPVREVGVVLGRLFPRDSDSIAQEAYQELRRSIPAAKIESIPGPPSLYRSMMDGLIVLDDLEVDAKNPFAWSPISSLRPQVSEPLANWMLFPTSRLEYAIFPGYHTVSEDALRQLRGATGNEMFLSTCALMAGGTRTVLLSRWRVGGQNALDLIREFAQELPHTTASDAWQRSVQMSMVRPLVPELEPRVKKFESADPPTAAHPFLWAGYMLVDTGAPPRNDDPPQKQNPPAIQFKGN